MKNIHLGCGTVYLNGWINIDSESQNADLTLDLTNPLLFEDNTIDFIYSEHFIEHLTADEGLLLLNECRRILKPHGVIRIATPDLDYLMRRYFVCWRRQDWIKSFGYGWLETRAEMMNLCFRGWGHQYLYNAEELRRRLKEAGYKKIYRKRFNKSTYNELRNRESRNDSKLILEAIK